MVIDRFGFVLGSGDLRVLGAPHWKGMHLDLDRGERIVLWCLTVSSTITQESEKVSLILQVRSTSKVTCIL